MARPVATPAALFVSMVSKARLRTGRHPGAGRDSV